MSAPTTTAPTSVVDMGGRRPDPAPAPTVEEDTVNTTNETRTPPGQRAVGRPRGTGTEAGPRGGRGASVQDRWLPGDGQAAALNDSAAEATTRAKAADPKARKVVRADLLRAAITAGLEWTPDELAARPDVPMPPAGAPQRERQVTWVPATGMTAALDKHAETAGITRNEAIRRYVAAWLEQHG